MVKSYYRYIQKHTFGHANTNKCLPVYSKGTESLLLGSKETVIFTNPGTGEITKKLKFDKKSSVSCLKLREEEFENYILAGFEDGDIHLRHFGEEEEITQEKNCLFTEHSSRVTCIEVNQDGNLMASGGDDNLLVFWDLVNQTPMLKVRGHSAPVTCMKFFKIGKTDFLISGGKDGLLKIWDLSVKICVQIFQSGRNEVTCIEKMPGSELSYAVGTDSEDILFVNIGDFGKDEESGLRVYCKERGKFTREFYSKVDQILYHQGLGYEILVLLADRKQVEVLRLRNKKEVALKFKRQKKRAKEQGKEFEMEKEEFTSQIGNWIEAIHKKKFKGKVNNLLILPRFKKTHNILYLFKSDNSFLSQTFDFEDEKKKKIVFEEMKNYEKMGHKSIVRATDISSDDSMCISCSNDSIKIWSSESSFQRIKNYEIKNTISCKFLPKDRYVILGLKNGNILLLDLQSSQIVQTIDNAHSDTVWSIDVHSRPDGAKGIRVVTSSADGLLIFWELTKSEEVGQIKLFEVKRRGLGEPIQWVKYTPNGQFYLAALLDNSIKMCYSDSDKLHLNFYGHSMPVLSIDVSSDDALLVSGSSDKYIRVWGMDFGDCHKRIFGHQGAVTQVKFVKDTHYVISCGRDGMIRYWDMDSKELIIEIDGQQGDIWSLSLSSIGDFFVVGGADRILRCFVQTKDIVYTQLEGREREEKVSRELIFRT